MAAYYKWTFEHIATLTLYQQSVAYYYAVDQNTDADTITFSTQEEYEAWVRKQRGR